MDDLNLIAKNQDQIDSLVQILHSLARYWDGIWSKQRWSVSIEERKSYKAKWS